MTIKTRAIVLSLFVALLAAAMFLVAAPAKADAWNSGDAPEVRFPLETSQLHMVGPRNVFGMRHFAKAVDATLDNVTITMGTSCDEYPEATCLVVEVDRFGKDLTWAGLTWINSTPDGEFALNTRTVQINLDMATTVRFRRYVARHEFLHVLGMVHWGDVYDTTDTGLLTASRYGLPLNMNAAESTALSAFYRQSLAAN